jgi:hypothetical protein
VLSDGAEGLIVHPGVLSEPPEDPTYLVTVKRAIHHELVLEDPLAGDNIGPRRLKNQVPHVVRQQGLVLLPHSVMPVGVCEHATNKSQDQRQSWGSGGGGELKMIHELGDPGSTTTDHQVGAAGITSHGDGVVDRRPDAT